MTAQYCFVNAGGRLIHSSKMVETSRFSKTTMNMLINYPSFQTVIKYFLDFVKLEI